MVRTAAWRNIVCPTASRPMRVTVPYIPALFWFARNTDFSTAGAGRAESGSRFTIEQRTSRIVTAMAGASSPSPNDSTPPNHSSSWKGTDRSGRITTFGRNLRTSGLSPASRPISRTVSEAITEMLASSKMPCFNCIICTGAPYRRPTSVAKSSPKTGISSPSGVRT